MENEEKEVFTAEDIKEQAYEEIIKDVIEEIDSREENLKVYYPYFVINKKLQDEKTEIDLNSVFVAILSYLLYTGKLNNRKIEYQDIIDFTEYFIYKIYNKKQENVKEIVNKILDVAQNNGNNFTYEYYSLKEKENKDRHIKYIEIKLGENGKLNYYITPQGIDFYLKTKEFPDSAQITINLLLFRKQIEKGSFNYAYDTIKRLNIEVKKKSEQKELVLEALMYGGKEGIEEYNKYHESVEGQINEEEELFGEVLIPQAVFDELTSDKRFQVEADQICQKEFIFVKRVNVPESVNILKRATGLDQGESEAIVLTDELKADILLMDEARGRNVSAQMGLSIMGTIGILMAAYEEKELTADEVRECIDGLQRAGRHIGQRHYQMLLSRLKD